MAEKAKKVKKLPKRKILTAIIIIALILIIGGGGVLGYKVYRDKLPAEKKVIATVGGEKIYQSELDALVYSINYNDKTLDSFGEEAKKIKKALLGSLIERKILEIKAKELGIVLGEEEILSQARADLENFDQYETERRNIVMATAKDNLLRDKISAKVLTWRSGKIIVVRGDLHFHSLPNEISLEERSKLVPEDLKYGKELIDSIYSDIRSGKISFEQGMDRANSDTRLGVASWKGWKMTFSQAFTKEDSLSRLYPASAPDFWGEVGKTDVGRLSQPITLKVTLGEDSPAGKKDQLVDGFYVIIRTDDGNNGQATSYNAWLLKAKSEVGVKINCF